MLNFPLWKKLLILFVSLFGLLYSAPNFLVSSGLVEEQTFDALPSWMPSQRVNLGLDLQGGAHLLLELDDEVIYENRLLSIETALRRNLRDARIRAHSFRISNRQLEFSVRMDDTVNLDEISSIINGLNDQITIISSPQSGAGGSNRFVIGFNDDAQLAILDRALSQSIEVVRRRVDEFGTTEPLIQRQGQKRILVQVPGIRDTGELKSLLNTTAKMSFHMVDRVISPAQYESMEIQFDKIVFPEQSTIETPPQRYFVMDRNEVVGGEQLDNAQSTFQNGQAVVSFTFNGEGARAFGDATSRNVNRQLAIILDDEVISAPRINEPILGGSGIISGNFTVQSAENLSILLRAGALPAPLNYIEERSVGPGLGQDSIDAGRMASIIALIAVSVFMVLGYGRFGVFALIALATNLLIILAIISVMQITLTLPGIAGLVLTIGMAVDANVLIFERIREEIRANRGPANALETGYRRAITTIIDSNLTTFIAAILLFSFGSGPIKGFALTLSIGLVSSVFTAIMVTRFFVVDWLRRTKPKSLKFMVQ